MKILKIRRRINCLDILKLKKYNLDNKSINLIDVEFNQKKAFEKISNKSKPYIDSCFKIAFHLIKSNYSNKLINGPVSKNNFLNNKTLGITEYISNKFSIKKNAMLIYNKDLSVCPLTTHLPIKLVVKNINKKSITEKIKLIVNFYKKNFTKNPKIAILGLNPHCESIEKFNEDEKIIKPAVKYLIKSGYKVSGPYSADTIFLNENRKNLM